MPEKMHLSFEPDTDSHVKANPMIGFTRFRGLTARHHEVRKGVDPWIMIECHYERSEAAALCLTERDATQLWTMLGTLLGRIALPPLRVRQLLLRTDGTYEALPPCGTLDGIRELLDASQIETIPLADGRVMVLDLEGSQNEKLLNPVASLAAAAIGTHVRVVGDVIVCPVEYLPAECAK
jgi:hypothetical protein